jgi:predicted nucleotide-binding protein
MSDTLSDLRSIKLNCVKALKIFDDVRVTKTFETLDISINKVAHSWSHSWIGYQAYIYYTGFSYPQSGDMFSIEWGLRGSFTNPASGNWQQFSYEQVVDAILIRAKFNEEDIIFLEKSITPSKKTFQESRNEFINTIEILHNKNKDSYLEKILNEATKVVAFSQNDIINGMRPTQVATRDSEALSQGIMTPPHVAFQTFLLSLRVTKVGLENLINCINKAEKYFDKTSREESMDLAQKYIFIGHGRSTVWKELKDFLRDRLKLEWEEFNREPTAGVSITERLQEMMGKSKFAFIIMTAEDEHSDGNVHARENVVHEAGLFQGKLGFRKAIILLEEGCTEFSNIHGLGQIRFPTGKIASAFEEIRRVLEREEIK